MIRTRPLYKELSRLLAAGFGTFLLTYSFTACGDPVEVRWMEGVTGAALIAGSLLWAVAEKASEKETT